MKEPKSKDDQKRLFRSDFPHTEKGHIYMNHASISPMSKNVSLAIRNFIEERRTGPIENFEGWMKTVQDVREKISLLIHSSGPERITFMGNTSDGISAVAEGFSWKTGDEIILNTTEFPANIQPFRILEKNGVRLVFVKPEANGIIPPEKLEDAVTERTRMISISAVQYASGFKADLKSIGDICRRNNLFFVVDGIQGLGAADIDVQACNIDAMATGGHKWLMSPMGTGFLYISDRIEPHLAPSKTGWLSVEDPWQLTRYQQNWKPLPQHLETGTLNIMGIIGMNAALDLFLNTGIHLIQSEIESVTTYLYRKLQDNPDAVILTPEDPRHRAGIISFSIKGKEHIDEIVKYMRAQKITISARGGLFRISPHYYNSETEIDSVLHYLSKA
jgi:cysteine desulfurase / selenocysteine lyase